MRKVLFILAIAGIFAACNSTDGQEKNEKASTEISDKKSDCNSETTDKEAKSDCDGEKTAETKAYGSDCCDSKKKSDCEGETKKVNGDSEKKAENVAGNVPC